MGENTCKETGTEQIKYFENFDLVNIFTQVNVDCLEKKLQEADFNAE